MQHTIEFSGERLFTRGTKDKAWLAQVTCDLATLPQAIVQELAYHGLDQKIADSASQAKNADEAQAMMQKAWDALALGLWTRRGNGGGGVDEFTATMRVIVRKWLKAKLGDKSPKWKDFTGESDAVQLEKLDKLFADNEAAFRPTVEAAIAAKVAERERNKGLGADIVIDM